MKRELFIIPIILILSPIISAQIYEFTIPAYNLKVQIHDGAEQAYTFEHFYFQGPTIISVPAGHPVGNDTVKRFKEYINFSLDLYNKSGFNEPETGADGDLDVTLINSTSSGHTPSTGGTSLDGSITIFVGFNNITDKATIEHELIHSIHNKKVNDTNNIEYIRRSTDRFKNEGFAEYFGIKSTMLNFNITEEEILSERNKTIGHNLEHFLENPDINIFSDWPFSWAGYSAAYLYFKYIAQVYGEEKLMHIYYSQKNYGNPGVEDANDTVGIGAINQAFLEQPEHNVTFNDTFIDWTIWLWENYENKIGLTLNITYNGTEITEHNSLEPWGTDYERIKPEKIPFKINFQGNPNKKYSIIILKINYTEKETPRNILKKIWDWLFGNKPKIETIKDKDIEKRIIQGEAIISINEKYDEIILIKSQINCHTSSNYNVTIGTGAKIKNSTITNSETFNSNITDSIVNSSNISDSSINISIIENSTLINCTIINSTIINSTKTNCIVMNSKNINSNVTDSTEKSSTIDNSIITKSNVTDSVVQNSTIEQQDINTTVVINDIPKWDSDADEIPDSEDNCPYHYNPRQEDYDIDLIGNVCDNCPYDFNPNQEDTDEDRIGNICDNCPETYNPNQEDSDQNGIGNACELKYDYDQDGIPDSEDNCPHYYNPEQEDYDFDGIGDYCDNCPDIYNPLQLDDDNDKIGNECDYPDADNDGIQDELDNCPETYNPEQQDADSDGIGDNCDPCPEDPNNKCQQEEF